MGSGSGKSDFLIFTALSFAGVGVAWWLKAKIVVASTTKRKLFAVVLIGLTTFGIGMISLVTHHPMERIGGIAFLAFVFRSIYKTTRFCENCGHMQTNQYSRTQPAAYCSRCSEPVSK